MKRVLVVLVLLVVIAAAVLKLLVFELPRVGGNDMAPALQTGDLLLANRLQRTPARGQLVLLEHPEEAGRLIVRRVVGLPGERVSVQSETPVVNGSRATREAAGEATLLDDRPLKLKVIKETVLGSHYPVLKDPTRRSVDTREVTLAGAYYVLSDNRNHGTDSRTFGPVPADHIRALITHRVSAGPGSIEGQAPREGWTDLR